MRRHERVQAFAVDPLRAGERALVGVVVDRDPVDVVRDAWDAAAFAEQRDLLSKFCK